MMDALALLGPPFAVACCLVGIHTCFGLEVLKRNVVFVDLALAQIAALGATVAFMLGHPAQGLATYTWSLGFTLVAAALLAGTKAWSERISQEALIGVIYVVAAAAAVLLIDRAPQGSEHLKQILTGNILTTGIDDLLIVVPLYAVIAALLWFICRNITTSGTFAGDYAFYAMFGIVVTSSVALAGVLLVFSFLIIPAAIGMLHADKPAHQLAIAWIAGVIASALGLAVSFMLDLPTGGTMVCAFGAALTLAGLAHPFLHGDARLATRRGVAAARYVIAFVLAGSALLLMLAPRADQPLLDIAETVLPSLRALYFTASEAEAYADAHQYAERYRQEAERLNALEARSRARDEALDDAMLGRVSSFLKSYGEMTRGEEFVMREVRSRARERMRWVIGAALLTLAGLALPGSIDILRRAVRRNANGASGSILL